MFGRICNLWTSATLGGAVIALVVVVVGAAGLSGLHAMQDDLSRTTDTNVPALVSLFTTQHYLDRADLETLTAIYAYTRPAYLLHAGAANAARLSAWHGFQQYLSYYGVADSHIPAGARFTQARYLFANWLSVNQRLLRQADAGVPVPDATAAAFRASEQQTLQSLMMAIDTLNMLNRADIEAAEARGTMEHDRAVTELVAVMVSGILSGLLFQSRLAAKEHELSVSVEHLQRLNRSEQASRAEAEAAVRVRERLLAAASHDLRTPLTMITGNLERVTQRLGSGRALNPDWLTTKLAAITGATDRMLATVEEITDAAQLQARHQLVLQRETVDLGELLCSVAAMVGEAVSRSGSSRIELHVPMGLTVECDRARMERVVQNIVGNALKYSPQETAVQVEAHSDGPWAAITVRDHGVGIPADEVPNIFGPFYRASTAIGIPGAGIGLAGAKQITEQHGGRIELESVLAVGTVVKILLPRADRQTESSVETLDSSGQRMAAGH